MPISGDVEGATDIEDNEGLIPTHITTKDELNEWEAANILKATKKYLTKKRSLKITVEWLKKAHKGMFDETWEWAGKFRTSDINIGIDWHNIQEQVKMLCNDIVYWKKEAEKISPFKISMYIHHRLVKIHPFKNGNGRHARLISDIYLFSHNESLPTWPNKELIKETDIRKQYINALNKADKGDYSLLEKFTRNLILES